MTRRQEHGRPTVVVVGGGITGLAAAWELCGTPEPPEVVLLEGSDRLGGKIAAATVAGTRVELGPDAFLARVPHAVELCRELGLGDELVAPAVGHAMLWTRGALRRLPDGLVLGAPSDLPALARSGIIGPLGLARAALDLVRPATRFEGDPSVGGIVAGRFGRQVLERLVDPLVGGINAGRSDALSAEAVAPQLLAAARESRSLLLGLRSQAARARRNQEEAVVGRVGAPGPPPVFLSHPGGLGRMVDTLARRLGERGVDIRTGAAVTSLQQGGRRWRVTLAGDATVDADAVVVTTPAPVSAGLLEDACPEAAAVLAGVEHASVVVATFAYRRRSLPTLSGTGFLVPRPEGRLMTAATYLSQKWPHMGDAETFLVRVSAGRHGDERALRLVDDEVADALQGELAAAAGLTEAPFARLVTRWAGAFPQYTVGHLGRVAKIEAAVAGVRGLEVAGAALRGIGIPACVGQGRAAGSRVLAGLALPVP